MNYDYDITYDIYVFMFYINISYFLHIYIYTRYPPQKKKKSTFFMGKGGIIYAYI